MEVEGTAALSGRSLRCKISVNNVWISVAVNEILRLFLGLDERPPRPSPLRPGLQKFQLGRERKSYG